MLGCRVSRLFRFELFNFEPLKTTLSLPMAFSRTAARQILQNIKSVKVSFSPFDAKSKSAREFFRRVSAGKVQETNKKAEIECVVREDYGENRVDVTFSHTTETLNLVTCDMIADEIWEEIQLFDQQYSDATV